MFLRMNMGLLISEDCSDKNPLVRFADISRSYQDIATINENSRTITIAPGDTANIVVNTRTLLADVTSEFAISFPIAGSDVARMTWTGVGTKPGFRTARVTNLDATSKVAITRLTPSIVRFTVVLGTAISTSATQVGDFVRIERSTDAFTSPFAAANRGVTFKVVGTTVSAIDVQDDGQMSPETGVVLGPNFAKAFKVLSPGPVKIKDTVIVDGIVSLSNAGRYSIVQVADDYVEFMAPQAYPETFTNGANLVKVYDGLIGFLNVRSNGPLQMTVDGGQAFSLGMLNSCDGIFVGSLKAYLVQATNDSLTPVNVSFQYVSLVG